MTDGQGRGEGLIGWWADRLRHREAQGGFTLIELLVVIVILAILAAVVVFAVSGVGDKGEAAAKEIDARTLRTAQEAYYAQNGRYGSEPELVAGGFLSEESETHKVYVSDSPGSCPGGQKCEYSIGDQNEPSTIDVHIGRSLSFVQAVINQFETVSGITVNEQYGNGVGDQSTFLAGRIVDSGDRPDVFFSQDAGNLRRVSSAGLFKVAPGASAGKSVDGRFIAADGTWTGASARVRVFAYNPAETLATPIPTTIDELVAGGNVGPWAGGKVAFDSRNASFQNFIAALIVKRGSAGAGSWLDAFLALNPVNISGNRCIAGAVSSTADAVQLGLINHYYRFQTSTTNTCGGNTNRSADLIPANIVNSFPVATASNNDVGSLINTAGAGILKATDSPGAAEMFVKYLLSDFAQNHWSTGNNKEYRVTQGPKPDASLPELDAISSPNKFGLDLNQLDNGAATALLQSKGLPIS